MAKDKAILEHDELHTWLKQITVGVKIQAQGYGKGEVSIPLSCLYTLLN